MHYNPSMETVTITKAEYESFKALEQQVQYLMEQLRLMRHRQFGPTSEKSVYDQLSLFDEAEAVADAKVPEPELVEIEKHYRKARRAAADRLPENLPVEVIEYVLPENECTCSECGNPLHIMGRDYRRELAIVPAQVKIVEHRCATYSCRHCEQHNDHVPIVKAQQPQPVIKGSFAAPEAVSQIMTQKFVMGVPLYRQEQELSRAGVLLTRQTMSNWLIRCAEDWLAPVYGHLKARLLERDVLHADETSLQVLREPDKKAQSKSYMWLYRTSGDAEHPIVLYEYQSSRKAAHPKEFLKDFKGYLHTDGYDAYHNLPANIAVVGCWAHLRRKFDEALKALPEAARADSLALHGKQYCGQLFDIERELAECSPEKRYAERQKTARRLMDEFFAWVGAVKALPKSGLDQAAKYALSQQKYLERYIDYGRLEISNNRAERSIKPFVIGRKNWLFANTPKGAAASATIYSIVETAKENGLNPYVWLTYIFKTAPNINLANENAIESLMPWNAPDYCKTPMSSKKL